MALTCKSYFNNAGEIVSYIFSMKSFHVGILCRVTLDIITKFYDAYYRYNKTVDVEINASDGVYKQGICVDSRKSELVLRCSTAEVEDGEKEVKNILEYVGSQCQKLQYLKWEDIKFCWGPPAAHEQYLIISTIVNACTQTKELVINGLYLNSCQETDQTNTSIHSITFGHSISFSVNFEDNFLECLSAKLPNLEYMTLLANSKSSRTIFMPSTSLK